MTKTELLKFIREQQLLQDRWVDSLPQELSMAFVSNDYVDSLHVVNERLMREVFGEAFEDASYFLYELKLCDDGHTQIKEADGTEWSFSDDSQFYEYFRKVCEE